MKKSLSLVLAAVLAFGMSATTLAAHTDVAPMAPKFTHPDNMSKVFVLKDGAVNTTTPSSITANVSNTNALYLELDTSSQMKASDIQKYKVRAEWSVGKDLVEKVSIVYKKAYGTTSYGYYVEIAAKPGVKVSKDDLQGDITVYKTSYKNLASPYVFKFGIGVIGEADIKFTAEDNEAGKKTTTHVVYPTQSAADAASEKYAKVVSFEKNALTETTITFETVGEFDVNVKDQDKLYLGFDRKANADIIAKHPAANLEFVNFPGKPAFYRTGMFYLYADDAETFVYEVKADGAIAAVKTVWDEDYDAHKFAVRQFAGTYIISDVELQLDAAPVAPVAPETKPNPNTGR